LGTSGTDRVACVVFVRMPAPNCTGRERG
jgi:hypothetical protein